MKDQYIGGSKDYGKYRLLTTFVQTTSLELGVQWCRTPDDETRKGGTRLSDCHDPLYRKMLEIASTKKLKLEDIELSGMLPGNTVYFMTNSVMRVIKTIKCYALSGTGKPYAVYKARI